MNRALIISINSESEFTGGGIYLRTLISSLEGNYSSVFIVDKELDSPINQRKENKLSLRKTLLSDLFSRLLLCPSFMMFYFFKILLFLRRNEIDDVYLHSSRLAGFIPFIKLFSRSRVIVCFDNNESLLSKQQAELSRNLLLKSYRKYDSFILSILEKYGPIFADFCVFITQDLKDKLSKNSNDIVIPVCLGNKPQVFFDKKYNILFTASFFFEPNKEAASKIFSLANTFPNLQFALAGQGAKKLDFSELPNLHIFDSLSKEKMEEVFRHSDAYLCPVEHGSGMKTKVAEAMSYGLPVLASKHSAVGYESVNNTLALSIYDDFFTDSINWYESLELSNGTRQKIIALFEGNYSISSAVNSLNKALCRNQ